MRILYIETPVNSYLIITLAYKITNIKETVVEFQFKFTYLSLAILEFLDIDFGDISKSESDLYRNDSRRCGRFCRTKPALGEPPSSGERAP